jgi:hypothetical protein
MGRCERTDNMLMRKHINLWRVAGLTGALLVGARGWRSAGGLPDPVARIPYTCVDRHRDGALRHGQSEALPPEPRRSWRGLHIPAARRAFRLRCAQTRRRGIGAGHGRFE